MCRRQISLLSRSRRSWLARFISTELDDGSIIRSPPCVIWEASDHSLCPGSEEGISSAIRGHANAAQAGESRGDYASGSIVKCERELRSNVHAGAGDLIHLGIRLAGPDVSCGNNRIKEPAESEAFDC